MLPLHGSSKEPEEVPHACLAEKKTAPKAGLLVFIKRVAPILWEQG